MAESLTTINPAALDAFLYEPGSPVMNHVLLTGEVIKSFYETLAPVGEDDPLGRPRRGPHLRDTAHVVLAHGVATVTVDSDHALYVEWDTAPHVIRARRAPFLVFFFKKAGRVMNIKQVSHPGTQGQFIMRHAILLAESAPLV